MGTIWFCIIAVMIAVYVVLDGFDLGAGAIHLLVGRNDTERRTILRSIGPVWDGNEVWLISAGTTLYFAFPPLYASGFSGLYLPLMMVLWLLILRGISIEFRNHVQNQLWRPFWDVVFSGASLLLAVFFGAALGNVVRGVPLDARGSFFLPLWTDFTTGPNPGILDWYTVLVGVAALVTLVVHGSLWVALKTEGAVHARASSLARNGWYGVLLLTIVITLASFSIQPHLRESFAARPWGYIFPFLAVVGLVGMRLIAGSAQRFLSSALFIIGMLTSVVFGLYPYVMPSIGNPAQSMTVHNAAAGAEGLKVGLYWFIPGMLLGIAYYIYVYRNMTGKVRLEEEGY